MTRSADTAVLAALAAAERDAALADLAVAEDRVRRIEDALASLSRAAGPPGIGGQGGAAATAWARWDRWLASRRQELLSDLASALAGREASRTAAARCFGRAMALDRLTTAARRSEAAAGRRKHGRSGSSPDAV